MELKELPSFDSSEDKGGLKELPSFNKNKGLKELPDIDTKPFQGRESGKQYNLNISKYTDYIKTVYPDQDINEQRAQSQGSLAKLGSGLVNTASSIVLDGLKDASYLLDFEQHANLIKGTEQEFGNWFGSIMDQAKEATHMDVYRTKASEGFHPESAGWWADAMPSIGSSLSMIIPTLGAVKGISALGKVSGMTKALGKLGIAEETLQGITAPIISRYMENTMEGEQTFKSTYQEAIKKLGEGHEEEAKAIAGEAARKNWLANSAMVAQDLLQYTAFFKGFKGASTLFGAENKAATRGADIALTMGSEGGEEMYQYTTDKESKRSALVNSGLVKDNTTFGDRMTEYMKDSDFWESGFLGAIGGGIFAGVSAYKDVRDQSKFDSTLAAHKAILTGDKEGYYKVQDEQFNNTILQHTANKTLDKLKDDLVYLASNPERVDDPTERTELIQRLHDKISDIESVESFQKKLALQPEKSNEIKGLEVVAHLEQRSAERRFRGLRSDIMRLEAQDMQTLGDLNDLQVLKYKQLKLKAEALKSLGIPTEQADAEISKLGQELVKNPNNGVVSLEQLERDIITTNSEELKNLYKHQFNELKNIEEIKENLANFNNPDKVMEFEKKAQKDREKKLAEEAELAEIERKKETEANKATAKTVDTAKQELDTQKNDISSTIESRIGELNELKEEELSSAETAQEANDIHTKYDTLIKELEDASEFNEQEYATQTEALNKQRESIIAEQENKENTEINSKDGIVPEISTAERRAAQQLLEETLSFTSDNGKGISPQGTTVTLGDLIIPAAHSIAYLSKEYTEEFTKDKSYRKLTDVSEELNKNMADPMILSNTQYQVGDTLFLEVDTAFNIIKDDKSVISYETYKNDVNLVPIKITNQDGKLVGYLHTLDWINPTNVASVGDNIALQRELLTALRNDIFKNGKMTVEINSKTFGKLSTTKENEYRPTSELIKDPNIVFAVGKDNAFWTGLERVLSGEQPVNKNITSGVVYMIVDTPVKGKKVALPVYNNKISDQIADTLTNAAEAFFTQNKTLANEVYKITGFDILTAKGLRKFFNLYVSTNSFEQSDLSNNVGRGDKLFLDVLGSGIKYGVGGDVMRDVGSIKYWDRADFNAYIKNAWTSVFLNHLDKPSFKHAFITNEGEVQPKESTYVEFIKENTTTDVVEYQLPDGSYTYFVQPVVTFGDPSKKDEIKQNGDKKADIERRRQEDLETTKNIGEDKLREGRENTKKIVESLKQRYPATSVQGIIIRILEKLIDFSKYSTIIDSDYLNNRNASGQATWFGMILSQETLDGILEGKEFEVHTFIHELIHGFTTSKISNYNIEKQGLIPGFKSNLTAKEKNAIEQLQRIFEKVKRDNPKSKEYGFTNLDEFIAEAFSNSSFQYTLKNTKAEGKKSNLFSEFINAIGDLLFEQLERWAKRFNKEIPQRDTITGILEDVLAWTEDLIDQNNKLVYIATNEEINAKYDAELAALEKKKTKATKEKPLNKKGKAFGDLGNGELNLDDQSPVFLKPGEVRNIAKESSLISGFTASQQAQIINMMNHYILTKLKSAKKEDDRRAIVLYSDLKEEFKNYAADYEGTPLGREFEKILANYGEFAEQSQARLLAFNVKSSSNDSLMGIEDIESDNEKVNFDDGAIFQIDSKEGMSSRLKQFFSFIPNPKKNYLGADSYMSYDEVVNYLSGQLAGLEASYEDISSVLNELTLKQPWIASVKEQLDTASEQVRNEFVQWATKHYTGFKIVNIIENKQGTTVKVMDADQGAITKVILAKWYQQLKSSNLVKENEPGILVLDNETRASLVAQIEAIDKNNLEDVKSWLEQLGIDISMDTLESIKNNPRFPWVKQFSDANGIFKTIIDNLSKPITSEDSFDTNNPMLNNSGIKKLAAEEAKYSRAYFSNSHKNGEGKTIFSYSANKFFINQFYKLKRNKDNYLEKLSKISFSSTSEWIKKLSNPNSYFSQVFDYFYVDTLKINKNDGTTLDEMSSREHEMTKLGLFWNQNNGSGKGKGLISHFLFPTMSDKSTMVGLTALRHELGIRFEGDTYELNSDTIDAVAASALAEYKRIRASYNLKNNISGYNPSKFYFFEELNHTEGLWEGEGNRQTLIELNPTTEAIVKGVIEKHIRNLASSKKAHWEALGLINKEGKLTNIDKTYEAAVNTNFSVKDKTADNLTTYAAIDFVTNYLIANANAFQMFIGDPAQYAKKTMEETWINIGKRLAGEIAPGLELADSKDNKYVQAFIDDDVKTLGALSISKNIDQIEKLLGKENSQEYRKIQGTDAQEWTTLKEHLYVLEKSGKITPEQTKEFLSREASSTLTRKDYNIILQPIKPVYVNTQLEPSMDLNRKIYIKSSSFPLIKGLTPELDKLREAMIRGGIDRVAFKTATKVGGPEFFNKVFKEDGSFVDDMVLNNNLTLDRSGFRIQQDVPFDESKDTINRGTQESKLLFTNILEVEGFEYNGETLTGKQLQDKYNELNKELFENSKQDLLRLINDADGNVDLEKVRELLVEEATSRSWPQNDIDALKLIKKDEFTQAFALPLWSSTSASRIEALLNSLVDNRVRKQKMRGNSFVLGSEEGFTKGSSNIIYTKSYDPTKGLQPQRIVNGKVLPAQILIPNKLRGIDGEIFHINSLTDLENIDPDLLKVFGFRIPTQGLNSMSYVEIVGFLPGNTDLVIGPKDWTKQMGSDFDVDKLYSYMYNAKLQNGKLQKYNFSEAEIEALYKAKEDEAASNLVGAMNPKWADYINDDFETFKFKFKQKELQNKILDVHFSVMSNPNPEVQKQIIHPLGFGNLPELASEVDKARTKRFKEDFKPTRLSDQYQKEKYLKARAGKTLTGIKSLNVVFLSIAQERGLFVRTISKEGSIPYKLYFGDASGKPVGLNDISNIDSVDKGVYKIAGAVAYQSAAVDNEKEQLLEKINSNAYTVDAEFAFIAVGFTESFVVPLTSQDIMFDYTDEMSRTKDSLNEEFIANPEQTIIKKLIDDYATKGGLSPDLVESLSDPDYPLTQQEMWDAIKDGNKDPNYYKTQIRAIVKFGKAREIGKELSNVQLAVNTDSSGVAPSIIESVAKEEKVKLLGENKYIENAVNLLDNTINGYATENALFLANKLWANMFPYSKESIQYLFNEIQLITGKERLTSDNRFQIFNNIKSFIYSKQSLGLDTEAISDLRKKLFFETPDNKSLAAQVKQLQETSKNPFIIRLTTEIDTTGTKPSLIKYNAGSGENMDELSIYQGFTDLIINPTTRELAQNLVTYFYLSGGIQQAIQFGKYIPNVYLTNIPFAKELRELQFDDETLFGINAEKQNYYDVSNFTKQWIQHNPNKAIRLKDDQSQISDIKTLDETNRGKKTKIVKSFTININEGGAELLVDRRDSDGFSFKALPEFVNLNYKLYQYIGNGQYIQIDTLGTFGYSEWNQGENNIESNILENKSNIVPIQKAQTASKETLIADTTPEVTNNQPAIDRVAKYDIEHGIQAALYAIIDKTESPLHKELAKQFLNNLTDYPLPTLTTVKDYVVGVYKASTKTIGLNPKYATSDFEFERAILHELVHHFTVGVINAKDLTPSQERIINSLKVLQKVARDKILAYPELKAEYELFVKNFESNNELEEYQVSKYYGLMESDRGLKEFVTMVMTDYKFQEMLNRIPFTADKTLLDRFLELVNSILSSIGFSVNENSVLKAAVENTVELINLGNKEYVEETIDLQSTKENTIFVERKMEPAVLTNKKPYILPDGRTINFNEQQSQAQASVLSQKATGNVIDTDNKSPVSSKLPELKRC